MLADSSQLAVGQKVYAIGNPFGLGGTMTRGIISSIRTLSGGRAHIDDAIQTDAAINPGNSGGPLLNSHGEVIGINTMIASNGAEQSSGIGFATPINTAKAVLSDFTRYGRVKRPSLGIETMRLGRIWLNRWDWQRTMACSSSAWFQEAPPSARDCAAATKKRMSATAEYLGGDLIVAMDGREMTDPQDIRRA